MEAKLVKNILSNIINNKIKWSILIFTLVVFIMGISIISCSKTSVPEKKNKGKKMSTNSTENQNEKEETPESLAPKEKKEKEIPANSYSDLIASTYNVCHKTDISNFEFPINKFLSEDLSIDLDADSPKILLYHSHASEDYCDDGEGVIGVGKKMKTALEERYQIPVIHITKCFDDLDDECPQLGSFKRAREDLETILKENPSIEIAIDIHRDIIPDNIESVININGSDAAKIMFINVIGTEYSIDNKNFEAEPNEFLYDNLAFSFQLQQAANELYPNFANKIILKANGSLHHMLPKSLYVNVGGSSNTQLEAENSADLLADILANVIIK